MKARNKRTGEIVDIEDMSPVTYKSSEGTWAKKLINNFIFLDAEKDYYTKLEHQSAVQFMQAMISSSNYIDVSEEAMADASLRMAHALVQKLKEKEE